MPNVKGHTNKRKNFDAPVYHVIYKHIFDTIFTFRSHFAMDLYTMEVKCELTFFMKRKAAVLLINLTVVIVVPCPYALHAFSSSALVLSIIRLAVSLFSLFFANTIA